MRAQAEAYEAWEEKKGGLEGLPLEPAQEAALSTYLANRYHLKTNSDMKNLPDYSGATESQRKTFSSIRTR
mgnify:CR=1 FL=1